MLLPRIHSTIAAHHDTTFCCRLLPDASWLPATHIGHSCCGSLLGAFVSLFSAAPVIYSRGCDCCSTVQDFFFTCRKRHHSCHTIFGCLFFSPAASGIILATQSLADFFFTCRKRHHARLRAVQVQPCPLPTTIEPVQKFLKSSSTPPSHVWISSHQIFVEVQVASCPRPTTIEPIQKFLKSSSTIEPVQKFLKSSPPSPSCVDQLPPNFFLKFKLHHVHDQRPLSPSKSF